MAAPLPPFHTRLHAQVKHVLSGDTVVLVKPPAPGAPVAAPPPEIRLTLASLQAPPLFPDEKPCAYDSREFLRSRLVGRAVQFVIEYKVEHAGDRLFGSIFVCEPVAPAPADGSSGDTASSDAHPKPAQIWTSVSKAVVRAGMAKVRAPLNDREACAKDIDELRALEETAQTEQIGIYSPDAPIRLRQLAPAMSSNELLALMKGHAFRATVEYVITGSVFRVLVSLPDGTYRAMSVQLAGLQCPGFRREAGSEKPLPLPFALNAKFFSEMRVLGREIHFVVEHGERNAASMTGDWPLYVRILSVTAPAGSGAEKESATLDLGEELLRAGFAKTLSWSLGESGVDSMRMRLAEKAARDARRGVWVSFEPPAGAQLGAALSAPFEATVQEVVSGDTLVVVPESGPHALSPVRISLASVRAPRPARGMQKEEYMGADAREFLRRKCIGKRVSVHVQYQRVPQAAQQSQASSSGTAPMLFADVFQDRPAAAASNGSEKLNGSESSGSPRMCLSTELVRAGYATVIKHRSGEDTSSVYEDLLQEESQAVEKKRGLHKPSPAGSGAPRRVNDLGAPDAKKRARDMLPFLEKAGAMRGVVEHASTGSRFRVYIPKDHMIIPVALRAARAPAPARRNATGATGTAAAERGDPMGDEALFFARSMFLQRDVDVTVCGIDRNGTYLVDLRLAEGSSHSSTASQKARDCATLLLEHGFAELSVGPSGAAASKQYESAEASAKAARCGIWQIKDPNASNAKVAVEPEESATAPVDRTPVAVRVVEVGVGGRIFYRKLDVTGDDGMGAISAALAAVAVDDTTCADAREFKVGEMVLLRYPNGVFRARVLSKNNAANELRVRYSDFGLEDVVSAADVERLLGVSRLSSMDALARELTLDGVVVAGGGYQEASLEDNAFSDAQYADDALAWLREQIMNQTMDMVPVRVDKTRNVTHAELYFAGDAPRQSSRSGMEAPNGEAAAHNKLSVNQLALRQGFARVLRSKSTAGRGAQSKYGADELIARSARLRLFEYGDPYASDQDDESR
ncbi:Ribonuclease TUDOR 2 [Porphyridium purpureum]|uniref:Ribonuclease TUDOR 2 n=1 Tax=Porphyridium purpureum TaxID=35688 RepID=A0A5J4YN22_PORPP|nr:Ribonuclease TUDOR 2 [Porphyridium purpureum]|eukprot:POR0082..scf222_8